MTMMSAKQVIAGLRSKNKELKTRIEAVEHWHQAQIGNAVDPTDIIELGKILGVSE